MKTQTQRQNLVQLAEIIKSRSTPLGVGLHNQCWAGLAIEIAKENGTITKDYFGLTVSDMKPAINLNNSLPVGVRNKVMANKTIQLSHS